MFLFPPKLLQTGKIPGSVGARTKAKKRWNQKPSLETLEERTVPSTMPLNLTSPDADGFLNGAYFRQIDPHSTGTGVIEPIVRLQAKGTEHGYNTGYRPVDFDELNDPNFTRSVQLADVPLVTIPDATGHPTLYRKVMLDINESKPQKFISLDELQFYQQSSGNLSGAVVNSDGIITNFGAEGANLIYDLDSAGDDWVKLNYLLNHGSGSGDMFAYVPNSLFAKDDSSYIVLYSKFGVNDSSEAGFEEWSLFRGTFPPGTTFTVSGQKFNDEGGDGALSGDPVIDGWTMNLYKETNGEAGLQADDMLMSSTSTANGGFYSFSGLEPFVTYYVTEGQQDGWVQTSGGNDGQNYYTIIPESDLSNVNFGNHEQDDGDGSAGDFRTQTQGGWGSDPAGENPGAYLHANADALFDYYGGAIVIDATAYNGTVYTFTTAQQITDFLPVGGDLNVIAQLLTLKISIGFDEAIDDFGASDSHLQDLVVVDPASPLYGESVADIVAYTEAWLSGVGDTGGYSLSDLHTAIDMINNNFTDGEKDGGFLG